jgi:hypothetical protein
MDLTNASSVKVSNQVIVYVTGGGSGSSGGSSGFGGFFAQALQYSNATTIVAATQVRTHFI